MALSISTVLVRALAIASLFFHLLCNFTCNVSEALILAMRVLLLSCLLNVSSRDSKALLRFAGLLYSSNAGFSFQSEGMTTLTNRSPYVYHCAALRTYLSQAHTCTSVHVPHFTTNNEVNRTNLSPSFESAYLPRAIIRARHSIPSHIRNFEESGV